MLLRSPRNLAFLSTVVLLFIFAVLRQSPWTAALSYEQIPLFTSSADFHKETPAAPGNDGSGYQTPVTTPRLPWELGRKKSFVDGEADRNKTKVSDWRSYLQEMLQWPRPNYNQHWPPFSEFIGKGYDPNRWEHFPL
jgi:hypothetical protein